MFRQLHKMRKNESGVILLIVLMLVIVLSVVAIGVLGLNVSQVTSGQGVVDSIKAEQLAIGAFYQFHQRQEDGTGTAPTTMVMDGKTYTISISSSAGVGMPNDTNQVIIDVTY